MIIRKQFTFEGAHVVRNCSSDRCKKSIHGHSYIVEVFLTADGFDNGMMVYDFGLLKGTVKELLDAFDHAYSLWNQETDEIKDFVKKHSARWIEMPVSPSAEGYALFFTHWVDRILSLTDMSNGEQNVRVHSVRVHETATGYAEAFPADVAAYSNTPNSSSQRFTQDLQNVTFSDQCLAEMSDKTVAVIRGERVENPEIKPNLELDSNYVVNANLGKEVG